jgi:hypothetical protein
VERNYVPLQKIKSTCIMFVNKLISGDNLEILKTAESQTVDLILS